MNYWNGIPDSSKPRGWNAPQGRSGPILLGAAMLVLFSCQGVQRYDGGFIFAPAPAGDVTEQGVEQLIRARTGIWLGMPRGIAEEFIEKKSGAQYGGQPTSGGVTTLRVPQGGYIYLLSYQGPPGSAEVYICGIQLRGVGGLPPPLVSPTEVRAAIGGNNYRRTPTRIISVNAREVFFIDRERCAHRDPGPPVTALD